MAEPDLFVEPRTLDSIRTLDDIVASTDVAAYLDSFVPRNPRYRELRAQLARLRQQEANGGWVLPGASGTLRVGDTGPAVTALRRRLQQTDDALPNGPDSSVFDKATHDAVVRFQTRHGLEPDGIVGRHTWSALNVPIADRIRQVIVNMERWRWMPDDLGRRYVMVNIAGFELEAVADGQVRHNMRVVVGRPYRRTPVFSSLMTYVEINPYWHVPPSIAVKDLLPKIRRSVDFLFEEGIRVFDGWGANARELEPTQIDWTNAGPARFPWKLRQDPGPKNALGQIKFMFPNQHNVYLHDTPARNLFSHAVRVFSSGCIRVERPRDLALFVLEGQEEGTPEALAAAFESRQTRKIALRDPLPVHITYQTAWVDGAGVLQLRGDVYERDAALARALLAPRTADRQ